MPGCAARQHDDLVHGLQRRLIEADLVEEHATLLERDPAENRLARRVRLLEDLLQHEVLVARAFGHDRVPQHTLHGFRELAPGPIGERHAVPRHHRHLLVAEEHDVARVAQDSRDVGCDEELAIAHADHHRRAVPDGNDLAGIVGGHEHDGEQAAQVHEGAPDGALETIVLASHARGGAPRSPCRFL